MNAKDSFAGRAVLAAWLPRSCTPVSPVLAQGFFAMPNHFIGHRHLLPHRMLTWLTSQGVSDSVVQLINGHASKKSLEVYRHLSLEDVQPGYQKAVKELEI